jgi:hypothetical protein
LLKTLDIFFEYKLVIIVESGTDFVLLIGHILQGTPLEPRRIANGLLHQPHKARVGGIPQ